MSRNLGNNIFLCQGGEVVGDICRGWAAGVCINLQGARVTCPTTTVPKPSGGACSNCNSLSCQGIVNCANTCGPLSNYSDAVLIRCGYKAAPGGGAGHGTTPKPTPHCTKITDPSSPYAGHCVGDQCGPGGAGSVMTNGLCSRSNPPPPGGGGSNQGAAQVEFDLIQTLRMQLGAAFVNQNETCLRDAIKKFSTNFNAMQKVAYQGADYNNYKTGLLTSLKQSFVCIPEGGSKSGGTMACTGGQIYGTCSGSNRPALCNVDCNNIQFFDSLVSGLPAFCNDANCCRQAQANINCSAYGAGPGPMMMAGGGPTADCIGIPVGCSTLGLIGAVMIFGMFVLVVLKR